jgi:GalNAc-alpha-(1->4)-GalNAc-alpha-(1->3)-diNAcBac-PP-undecaprenol alpha-1,4-N-acetyl-D-galactosaminyltransferase
MRIFFLVSSLGRGGAERVAVTLCSAWASAGHEVTLVVTFSGFSEFAYEIPSSVRVVRLNKSSSSKDRIKTGSLSRLWALRRLVEKDRPGVVISFLSNVNIAAVLATRFTNVPCVISERSSPQMLSTNALLRWACQLAYPFADAFVVQADGLSKEFSRFFLALPPIKVIPNPLPDALVSGFEVESITRARKMASRKTLLSMGRLDENKRMQVVLEAFSIVMDKHKDWVLKIVGDGPKRSDLEQYRSLLPAERRARIVLSGGTNEPWHEMASAQAFVLASKIEGLPNVLIEAVALGLPCVSTNSSSGLRAIAGSGRSVAVVPVDDLVALSKALSQNMEAVENGVVPTKDDVQVFRNRFSLRSVLQGWDAVFQNLHKNRSEPTLSKWKRRIKRSR